LRLIFLDDLAHFFVEFVDTPPMVLFGALAMVFVSVDNILRSHVNIPFFDFLPLTGMCRIASGAESAKAE